MNKGEKWMAEYALAINSMPVDLKAKLPLGEDLCLAQYRVISKQGIQVQYGTQIEFQIYMSKNFLSMASNKAQGFDEFKSFHSDKRYHPLAFWPVYGTKKIVFAAWFAVGSQPIKAYKAWTNWYWDSKWKGVENPISGVYNRIGVNNEEAGPTAKKTAKWLSVGLDLKKPIIDISDEEAHDDDD